LLRTRGRALGSGRGGLAVALTGGVASRWIGHYLSLSETQTRTY
jgi:hypothetical protein